MSEYEDLQTRYTAVAASVLPPLVEDALTAIEESETGDDLAPVLSDFMARAFMQGVGAGQSEVLAQAIEAGVDLKVNMLGGPEA